MSSKGTQFKTGLLHPRHWPIWLAFGLWRAGDCAAISVAAAVGQGHRVY